ncbi:helix-turn-helix domain-containing protein [Microbacterium capsulatum]|uniref:Helix-turn-helix domain-containing protein n=1 Tax=Microbacterium capsulatum TaxID=3041921 RepID=A0ABU0XK54_9MICO|nr:helix-turn-helix domain-containing protein [Microbacterium sp. ASV81]MDQ4215522.1 helix-turn-helix domain-containing protein [Microbacterium sp. ASV81]
MSPGGSAKTTRRGSGSTPRAPRAGVYAKGVAKREEILATALTLVAERGYRSASVRDIADAVGLSPAGLLHYFGTKEDLFLAILQARDERDSGTIGDRDFLEAFVELVRHNAEVPGLVALYTQLQAEAADPVHPARAFFADRTARLEAGTRDAIVAAQEAGELRADLDPAWIMRASHALADGLQSAWMLDPTIDMAADLEAFIALLRPAP